MDHDLDTLQGPLEGRLVTQSALDVDRAVRRSAQCQEVMLTVKSVDQGLAEPGLRTGEEDTHGLRLARRWPVEELARRIEDLEIRLTFQDDLVRQLDEVVQSQSARIDQLLQEIHALREQVNQNPAEEAPMEEQVPPHW